MFGHEPDRRAFRRDARGLGRNRTLPLIVAQAGKLTAAAARLPPDNLPLKVFTNARSNPIDHFGVGIADQALAQRGGATRPLKIGQLAAAFAFELPANRFP